MGRAPSEVIGSAVVDGETTGYAKTIVGNSVGELPGAQITGIEAAELIPALSVLQHLEGADEDFAAVVMSHPSDAEALDEAVMAAWELYRGSPVLALAGMAVATLLFSLAYFITVERA